MVLCLFLPIQRFVPLAVVRARYIVIHVESVCVPQLRTSTIPHFSITHYATLSFVYPIR